MSSSWSKNQIPLTTVFLDFTIHSRLSNRTSSSSCSFLLRSYRDNPYTLLEDFVNLPGSLLWERAKMTIGQLHDRAMRAYCWVCGFPGGFFYRRGQRNCAWKWCQNYSSRSTVLVTTRSPRRSTLEPVEDWHSHTWSRTRNRTQTLPEIWGIHR